MKRLIVLMHYFVIQTPDVSAGRCFQYWFRKYCYFTKGLLYIFGFCACSQEETKMQFQINFCYLKKMSINGYHVPFTVTHALLYQNFFFAKNRMFLHLLNIGFYCHFPRQYPTKIYAKLSHVSFPRSLSLFNKFYKVKNVQDITLGI